MGRKITNTAELHIPVGDETSVIKSNTVECEILDTPSKDNKIRRIRRRIRKAKNRVS